MRTALALLLLCSAAAAQARIAPKPKPGPAALRAISKQELRNKIAGGWAGQIIGHSFGSSPRANLPSWRPERVADALHQRDLHVEMTFALVLDEDGLAVTSEDFAKALRESKYPLSHASMAARRNLKRGVPAALAGLPRYNAHAGDFDFQTQADFIGLMAPGMPRAAAELAQRIGRITTHGDGIAGGVFVSCMYAAAYFNGNPRRVVQAGLACLPAQSRYALVIRDVLARSAQSADWRRTWKLVASKWDKRGACGSSAAVSGGLLALALLYGRGDFGRTLDVAARAGQNPAHTASTAAGILGVILGYKQIPDNWKSGLAPIADKEFGFTDYTFNTMVESTEYRAGALAKRHGGRVEFERILVRPQRPAPVRIPRWDSGRVAERISVADSRWSWTGDWSATNFKMARTSGAEATLMFEGTGAAILGPHLDDGGKADVWVDGKLDRTIDVFRDQPDGRATETIWHIFGLPPGRHTLRLAVRGEPFEGSEGTAIAIKGLLVFR